MNTNKSRIIALATALITATTTVAVAGDKKMSDESHERSSHSLMRVSEERVDGLTTAKDLIGSSVYDANGEKIGNISDISFSRNLMAEIKSESASWKKNAASDQSDSDTMASLDKANDKGEYSDKKGEAFRDMRKNETIVFISVGGLFGIGDDLVQVPASELSYDSQEERYLLANYTKSHVAEVAEINDENFNERDYYTTPPSLYSSYPSVVPGWDDGTTRAKRSFDSTDVDMIRDALDNDETIGVYASLITVEEKGDEVLLSGTVSDKKTKSRAEKLAKKNSDKSVVNNIEVSDY